MNKILLSILFLFLFLIIFKKKFNKLNQRFYDYKSIYPFLEELKKNKKSIKKEVMNIINDKWKTWPEVDLYKNSNGWKVLPFYGFGKWVNRNCKKCPTINNIIRNIPGLRTASLSKLTPGTKLEPHQGWAKLSNYVLRCQYGIIVGKNCILGCENEVEIMKENKIIVFDDSKMHYAQNNGNQDRIILILDIERPDFVKKGISDIENTDELNDFIKNML